MSDIVTIYAEARKHNYPFGSLTCFCSDEEGISGYELRVGEDKYSLYANRRGQIQLTYNDVLKREWHGGKYLDEFVRDVAMNPRFTPPKFATGGKAAFWITVAAPEAFVCDKCPRCNGLCPLCNWRIRYSLAPEVKRTTKKVERFKPY